MKLRFNWHLKSKRGAEGKTPSRRMLRFLGQSWAASPLRRFIQVAFFLLFLVLFLFVTWPYTASPKETPEGVWPSHYSESLSDKEFVPAESFLMLDPVVGLSSTLSTMTWTPAMTWCVVVLGISLFIPRFFCGYVCPFGTLIDFFDWLIWRHIPWKLKNAGPFIGAKYGLLTFVLVTAVFGIMTAGYLAAIPVFTRGFAFIVSPLELGLLRSWHQIPAFGFSQYVSIALFVLILCLGVLTPRFWCRYLCPSGAVFSLVNMVRLTDRKVKTGCVACSRCVYNCPFDAIEPADFSTRLDCTYCQTCGGVCPVQAIEFTLRGTDPNDSDTPPRNKNGEEKARQSRRWFLSSGSAIVLGTMAAGTVKAAGPVESGDECCRTASLIRPPASMPELDFMQQCVRCGGCLQACPNNVLQPVGATFGIGAAWTPAANFNWSGCEASCNNCTQVCPTGAIRRVSLEEKRHARMGLAVVNEAICLPYATGEACQLCYDDCAAAGYHAIEFMQVGTEVDDFGMPIEGSGTVAPVVRADLCVGCGLCQSRCYLVNKKEKHLLDAAAIVVLAEEGHVDRIVDGSYVKLREKERIEAERHRAEKERQLLGDSDTASANGGTSSDSESSQIGEVGDGDSFLPDFLK